MSVQARSQNLAYCAWDRDGGVHYGTFEVGTLRLVGDNAAPGPGHGAADDSLSCS